MPSVRPRQGEFRRTDIIRAQQCVAGLCSNPRCRNLTIGPSTDPTKPSILGEASHIYGRTATAARHRADLSIAQLRSPMNIIWLCSDCHKAVDTDEVNYPPELLFQWRTEAQEYARSLRRDYHAAKRTIVDCPWCAKPMSATATHCAYCPDVRQKPEEPLLAPFVGVPLLGLAAPMLAKDVLPFIQTAIVAAILATVVIGTFVYKKRHSLLDSSRRRGLRFMRREKDAVGDGSSLEFRYAFPREVSALQADRLVGDA